MLGADNTFVAQYGGRAYTLRLRTCDDGYISAYERAAVDLLLSPFASRPVLTMTELLMYEGLVSQILNLIVAEGARGGFEIANEYGEKSVAPLPWQFWYELDEQLIEQIFNRFFLSLAEKMKQLSASGNSTAIRKGEQLSFACEMLMNFQGSSPS